MSLFYALHQDQSTGTKRSGKWYARAKYVTTLNTRDIARIVERNATAKESDVRAVIREMVDVLQRQCQEGKRVVIEGLGWFKIGIESNKGAHIIFQPETKADATGNRSKVFLDGLKLEELPENRIVKEP